METQVVNGIHLPIWDRHFGEQIERNPIVDGKGTYQFSKINAVLGVAKRRRHAVDVGAHVGLWTRILAMHFESVTAFEPMPEHARCFELNLAGQGNVALHECALGERAAITSMGLIADDIASARIDEAGAVAGIAVQRLDDIDIMAIDLLKIDVEGFDLAVIRGGEQTIRRDRPVIIVEQKGRTEQYGGGRHAATELLQSWGAEVVRDLKGDTILAWPDT